jgi:hypothetical protein
LKNLLDSAEQQLVAHGIRGPEARLLLQAARDLPKNESFWQQRSKSLAIFASPEMFRAFRLLEQVNELLVVNRRFQLKSLLPLLSNNQPFFVLAISQNKVRFFEGSRFHCEEVEVKGLPANMKEALNYELAERGSQPHSTSRGMAGKQAAVVHGQGGERDTSKDDLAQYFRMVDAALHPLLRDQQTPLVLAGVEYLLPIYRNVCTYPNILEKAIAGNPDHLSARELHERAWPLVQPYSGKSREEAQVKYQKLAGTGKTSDNVAEVVPACFQGKVESLFVDCGAQQWGRFDPDTQRVELHDTAQPGDDDLLDVAAVQTALSRGAVYSAIDQQLPADSPIAAVFRF